MTHRNINVVGGDTRESLYMSQHEGASRRLAGLWFTVARFHHTPRVLRDGDITRRLQVTRSANNTLNNTSHDDGGRHALLTLFITVVY